MQPANVTLTKTDSGWEIRTARHRTPAARRRRVLRGVAEERRRPARSDRHVQRGHRRHALVRRRPEHVSNADRHPGGRRRQPGVIGPSRAHRSSERVLIRSDSLSGHHPRAKVKPSRDAGESMKLVRGSVGARADAVRWRSSDRRDRRHQCRRRRPGRDDHGAATRLAARDQTGQLLGGADSGRGVRHSLGGGPDGSPRAPGWPFLETGGAGASRQSWAGRVQRRHLRQRITGDLPYDGPRIPRPARDDVRHRCVDPVGGGRLRRRVRGYGAQHVVEPSRSGLQPRGPAQVLEGIAAGGPGVRGCGAAERDARPCEIRSVHGVPRQR